MIDELSKHQISAEQRETGCQEWHHKFRAFRLSFAIAAANSATSFIIALLFWFANGKPDFYFRDTGAVGFAVAFILSTLSAAPYAILLWPICIATMPRDGEKYSSIRLLLFSWLGCSIVSVGRVAIEFEQLRVLGNFEQIIYVLLLAGMLVWGAFAARA